MVISSPVAGLRPCRSFVAGFTRTLSWTRLPIFTFSALPISERTTSSSAWSADLASARERPLRSATASASCVWVRATGSSWSYGIEPRLFKTTRWTARSALLQAAQDQVEADAERAGLAVRPFGHVLVAVGGEVGIVVPRDGLHDLGDPLSRGV